VEYCNKAIDPAIEVCLLDAQGASVYDRQLQLRIVIWCVSVVLYMVFPLIPYNVAMAKESRSTKQLEVLRLLR
jgi:hypothetical protein